MALISRWSLEGNANDMYGLYNGTASNVTYSSDAKEKRLSGYFNRNSPGYIKIDGLNPYSYSSFTISLWVKCDTALNKCCISFGVNSSDTDFIGIFGGNTSNTWAYYVHTSDGNLDLLYLNSAITSVDNNWHHIVVTDVNGSVTIYTDGGSPATGSYTRYSQTFNVGTIGVLRYQGTTPQPTWRHHGYLDDVRFYDVALTANEVMNLYKSYRTPVWQTPISRWQLEGNGNDLYGLHNGTAVDMTYSSDSKSEGLSAYFNGASSSTGLVKLDGLDILNYTNFSISMWVKRQNSGSSPCLFQFATSTSLAYRYQLSIENGTYKLQLACNNNGNWTVQLGNTGLSENVWYHIVVTSAGATTATSKIYLNGVLYLDTSIPRYSQSNDRFTLGALRFSTYDPWTTSEIYKGYMDDVRFYDVALTADEVMNLYKSYATPIWNQPLHHWKFENDLIDSVGSSNGSNTNCTFYPNNNINGNYSIYIPKTPTGYPTFPGINIAGYTNFTWAFWFRSVISGDQQYLVMDWTYPGGPDERLSLVLNTNNRLIIYPYIGGNFRPIYSTTNLNIAAWNHVVLTASGTGSTYFTLYLNGKYDISGTQPRSTYATNTFRLGVHSPGVTAAKFDGYMDDFRIYDVALSAADVRALYNSYFTEKATNFMSML